MLGACFSACSLARISERANPPAHKEWSAHAHVCMVYSGFCAVSGSPVRPNDYNRYLLRLDTVTGKKRTGA
jgi:hypothetical protein